MATKKNQHIVPACYLKEFEAEIPQDHRANKKFQSGVYVNNKFLSDGWRLRSIRHSTFTKSYYYNVKGDAPNSPIIEEYLSKVENYYSKTIRKLKDGTVSNDILSAISYFTCLQFMRTEPFINSMQKGFDQIGEWVDEFSGNDDTSEELADITKRMLRQFDHGEILHPHSAIVVNSTNFPFVSSDNPVTRKQVNIDDLSTLIGEQYVRVGVRRSIEKAFFFLPLTPQIAYISCELLPTKFKGSVFVLDDLLCIYLLNYHGIKNAHENVYSSIVEPMKEEIQLSDILINKVDERSGYYAKIYTDSDRFVIDIEDYSSSNENIVFTTTDPEFCNSIRLKESVSLIEIYYNEHNCRGMRECLVEAIDSSIGKYTIVPKYKLGI